MVIVNVPAKKLKSEILSEIYNKYFPMLYKYTLYKVGAPEVAEDLVSEVFEKVLANYYTYNPDKGKFSTWLFTIANNTILNYHKKNDRDKQLIDIEKMQSKYRLEDLIIDRELKQFLLTAIMYLDERQRNIIALKFGACLANREIARVMDLTESNVGTILYRSLKKLKEILKEQGVIY
ncbi:MAG: sigma-70 family RNA polymerase sigma factor [Clostridiales bacterium]|nr:sigma-70 family RNA polymerase sigma factor [Clostridiales bacterium]MCF8022345.1 sigma-70 family RNA polymerase sigma factor [Clostridiales bacterium]